MDRPHLASRSGVVCPLADGGAARLHGGSCMSREAHVQFCESLGVRFPGATHLVLGFQYQTDAECFRDHLAERLKRSGLELHPDKTRRIEFGRFAESNRKKRGEGKPDTFDFLGFTHISGKDRNGNFALKRKTIAKRMRTKLREIKQELRRRMHDPVEQTGKWIKSVVQGYFNYHAVPGNLSRLKAFHRRVQRLWRWALRRRGQPHRPSWARILRLTGHWLPYHVCSIPILACALPPAIQDKNRMR